MRPIAREGAGACLSNEQSSAVTRTRRAQGTTSRRRMTTLRHVLAVRVSVQFVSAAKRPKASAAITSGLCVLSSRLIAR